MASFNFSVDMDKFFPKGIQDEKLALDMVSAAQEVILSAIKAGAEKHVVTGSMARSVKATKPRIDKKGDAVGRIKFYGSDGVSVSKNGQKFDRTNWIKAFRIEYGTSKQPAKPFVRPAIKSSESAATAAMQRVFDERAKK